MEVVDRIADPIRTLAWAFAAASSSVVNIVSPDTRRPFLVLRGLGPFCRMRA